MYVYMCVCVYLYLSPYINPVSTIAPFHYERQPMRMSPGQIQIIVGTTPLGIEPGTTPFISLSSNSEKENKKIKNKKGQKQIKEKLKVVSVATSEEGEDWFWNFQFWMVMLFQPLQSLRTFSEFSIHGSHELGHLCPLYIYNSRSHIWATSPPPMKVYLLTGIGQEINLFEFGFDPLSKFLSD